MKISFLGNFGVDFSSENHHARSLEALGHEVVRLQEREIRGAEVYEAALDSDMFVWVHTHGWDTAGLSMETVLDRLKEAGIPTVTYHLDLWKGLKRERDLDNDSFYKRIGHFFTVDKLMADWFNDNTEVKGHYLQAGVFHEEASIVPGKRNENDVIFVGSMGYHPEWPYRPELIRWLTGTYGPRFQHYGGDGLGVVRGWDLNQLYTDTKVVVGDSLCLNFDYPYYWSDRVYETLGRGGFLIQPYVKGMEEHFIDKEHLVFYEYGNFDQLRELIDYYLEHDDERERIRLTGHAHVKNHHTYKHRWEQILNEVHSSSTERLSAVH